MNTNTLSDLNDNFIINKMDRVRIIVNEVVNYKREGRLNVIRDL